MRKSIDTLLRFPCLFPVKIMGSQHEDFPQTIFDVIRRYDPAIADEQFEIRTSKNGSYVSITATITARSGQQLNKLYLALARHPLVRFVL